MYTSALLFNTSIHYTEPLFIFTSYKYILTPMMNISLCLRGVTYYHMGHCIVEVVSWCTCKGWFKFEPELLLMNWRSILEWFEDKYFICLYILSKNVSKYRPFTLLNFQWSHPHTRNILLDVHFPILWIEYHGQYFLWINNVFP